ncbi:DNA alkylation repair protein [Granulicoccus phenolivorans]|uniref:DNA alkylation repair protein n=1 Tax=Granulicoccus phenolivorans TaxID=266854 RepID=UPI0003F5D5C3|nr:DNA alkylation repair protein [Granulicoccus phenolivorans]
MSEFAAAVRTALAAAGDPRRAAAQQRYMKSDLPFHGVAVPEVRRLTRALLAEYPIPDETVWEATIRELWDPATHREERYAALAVARYPRHRRCASRLAALACYEHLIVSAAWWDLVDDVAHLLELVLETHPEAADTMRDWSRRPDLWLRRGAILCQLGRGPGTDPELLAYCIEGSIGDPDFFARKAIGWALRQYARTDPGWVEGFLAGHPELAPLSVREARRALR